MKFRAVNRQIRHKLEEGTIIYIFFVLKVNLLFLLVPSYGSGPSFNIMLVCNGGEYRTV